MTYSSTMSISRQQLAGRTQPNAAWGRNQNTTRFESNRKKIGPVSNTIILVVLACLLGLLYLTQVTKTNAYGYQINDLQKEQTSLTAEHEELEVAAARLQAVDRVSNSDVAKSLVSVAPSATVQN